MTIVEDDAIDEDEVTVCILNIQYGTYTGVPEGRIFSRGSSFIAIDR